MEDRTSNSDDFFDEVVTKVTDSDNFFQDLEKDVNPAIYDDNSEKEQVTPEAEAHPDSNSEESGIDWDNENNPYKKRYSDSSREANNWKGKAEENEQYDAIINVMKKDPGLIETVQTYLETGGAPAASSLPDDFIFDPDEAMTDPGSTSAKVFESAVERIVSQKVGKSEQQLKNKMDSSENDRLVRAEARKWMNDRGVSEDDFASMMTTAENHTISYDDIYLILNQEKVKKNVSKSTKKDMMKQMKSVRQSPATASGAGSADTAELTDDDRIFETIRNVGSDNLFGS